MKAELTERLIEHKERPATLLEREAADRIVELESFAEFVRDTPLSADLRDIAIAVLERKDV